MRTLASIVKQATRSTLSTWSATVVEKGLSVRIEDESKFRRPRIIISAGGQGVKVGSLDSPEAADEFCKHLGGILDIWKDPQPQRTASYDEILYDYVDELVGLIEAVGKWLRSPLSQCAIANIKDAYHAARPMLDMVSKRGGGS